MVSVDEFFHFFFPFPLTDLKLRPPARPTVVVSKLENGRRWTHGWHWYRRQAASMARLDLERCEIFFSVAVHDVHAARALAQKGLAKRHLVTIPPSATSAVALPALWVTVRRLHDDDRRSVSGFLDSLPRRPSCVVASSTGYDVYWLLREPWMLEGAAEQAAAAEMLLALQQACQQRARRRGFFVVKQDLGHQARLPGSLELGLEVPRPATVEWMVEARYDLAEFEYLTAPMGAATVGAKKTARTVDQASRDLVHGLHRLLRELGGRGSVKQILETLARDGDGTHQGVRDALFELMPGLEPGALPSARSLGRKLSHLSDRVHAGLAVVKGSKDRHGVRWKVERRS